MRSDVERELGLQERINSDFSYHPATDVTGPQHEAVRGLVKAVALQLVEVVPVGRERSLMLTHLEEAMMWANAGIARHGARD